jgi:23S rRNA (uridine2552-2'-O)-methyltransferase
MAKKPGRAGKSGKPKGNSGRGDGARMMATRVKTASGRKVGSTLWLQRQLNDPYVLKAQADGYRSRAAYKLVELDDRFEFLKPGMRIADLGSAPGGWTQVAAQRTGAISGKSPPIIGMDIQEMDPIEGAELMQLDIFAEDAIPLIQAALGGEADIVLSDMAPSTTGHKNTDQIRIAGLAEAAYDVAKQLLADDGIFIVKVFQGGAPPDLLAELKRDFRQVRHVKPPASRQGSPEMYLVATGYRGVRPALG